MSEPPAPPTIPTPPRPAPARRDASTAVVLGIVGLVLGVLLAPLGLVPAIIGLVLASRAGDAAARADGSRTTAMLLCIIAIALNALGGLCLLGLVAMLVLG